MKILGVKLQKPSFNEITYAALMASLWWAASIHLWNALIAPLSRTDAGATLLVLFWGCLCARCGIRVDEGGRHLAANLACTAFIVGAYQGVIALLN